MKVYILFQLIAVVFSVFRAASAQACSIRGLCPPGLACFNRRCIAPLYDTTNYTRISEIQGRGTISALESQTVTTIGVETAIQESSSGNSYFIQDIHEDGDPLTSEGLYIFRPTFSGEKLPIVGDVVEVAGTVMEFTPSSRPNDLPVTELTSATG